MNFRERPYLESLTVAAHKNKKHHEKVSKMQVPFYCMFSELYENGKRKAAKKLGEVHCDIEKTKTETSIVYVLKDMSEQKPLGTSNVVGKNGNITKLITKYGINIGKVKIIFMEE